MRVRLNTKIKSTGSFKIRVEKIRKLTKISKKEVYAGLIEGLSDPHVIAYGTYNEFGTVHIPERSFIRSSVQGMKPIVKKIGKKGVKLLVTGKGDLTKTLDEIGAAARDEIQGKIISNIPPENAPSTIARKGHGDTLIDTGALFDNIVYEVR